MTPKISRLESFSEYKFIKNVEIHNSHTNSSFRILFTNLNPVKTCKIKWGLKSRRIFLLRILIHLLNNITNWKKFVAKLRNTCIICKILINCLLMVRLLVHKIHLQRIISMKSCRSWGKFWKRTIGIILNYDLVLHSIDTYFYHVYIMRPLVTCFCFYYVIILW